MHSCQRNSSKHIEGSVTSMRHTVFDADTMSLAFVVAGRLKMEVPWWSVGQNEAGDRKLGPRNSDFTSSALSCTTFFSIIHIAEVNTI